MLLLLAVWLPVCASAATAVRRALLIGIDDYSGARLPATAVKVAARDWKNLDGAVNDVRFLHDLLVWGYEFRPNEIVMLADHEATRAAILRALGQLAKSSNRGDVVLIYYSGHGSQVRNSKSTEIDGYDESLVPADSRRGTPDIRDKELRDAYNAILDRGVYLTIVMDSCHSGSSARSGLDSGASYRAVSPDRRDVADPSTAPSPESRGALVLTASLDFQRAYETKKDGSIHGAFSWALAQAMRDADPGDPAEEVFLRAQARLRSDRAGQDPVIAGDSAARLRPFLGDGMRGRPHRDVIAVERMTPRGTCMLDGGWASGVNVGSELRLVEQPDVRLQVTSLAGVSRAEARLMAGSARSARLRSGALLEIVSWAPPPSPPLRIWIPRAAGDVAAMKDALRKEVSRRRVRTVADPTETTPDALLRWREGGWTVITGAGSRRAGAKLLDAVPAGASLFVEWPASAALADALGTVGGVVLAPSPESADYILAGRAAGWAIEYAWVRPEALAGDAAHSLLPARTAWIPEGPKAAPELRELLRKLRIVRGWHELTSPAGQQSPYRVALRAADGHFVEDGRLVGDGEYQLMLRSRKKRASAAAPVYARYVYVFVIDSAGNVVLLFPNEQTGSVEHRLPLTEKASEPVANPPDEIALVTPAPVTVVPPYGADTYFFLSTNERLRSLAGLDLKGVRSAKRPSPLDELLTAAVSGTRGVPADPIRTAPDWSIDKVVFKSVAPAGRTR